MWKIWKQGEKTKKNRNQEKESEKANKVDVDEQQDDKKHLKEHLNI